MLNYHYAKMYQGKMILRFDDTNPMNEKIEFVENIIRDLKTLEITPDIITYTSDYFDVLKDYMIKMIEAGLAYADDTPSL
jgi:glutamyl-tRNA synthetase